jgi:hypothetical protein
MSRLPEEGHIYIPRSFLHTTKQWVFDLVYGCLAGCGPRNSLNEALGIDRRNERNSDMSIGAESRTSFSNMHLFSARSGFLQGPYVLVNTFQSVTATSSNCVSETDLVVHFQAVPMGFKLLETVFTHLGYAAKKNSIKRSIVSVG